MKISKIKIFIAIAIVVLTGGAIYYFEKNQQIIKLWIAGEPLGFARQDEPNLLRLNLNRYKNNKYGFSFSHPKEYNASEFTEGGADVVLVKDETGDGFQISIAPFDESGSITKERILKDIPDMAISGDENIVVGGFDGLTASGEKALSFISQDDLGGKTREIWFARGGYLYQIKAYENFEKELLKIIKTWKF